MLERLLDFWESQRGYYRWTETTARIDSTSLQEVSGRGGVTWFSRDTIRWKDANGEEHFGSFRVSDKSSLYMEVEGNAVTIRYDPLHPDKYYYRALLADRITMSAKALMMIAGFIALIEAVSWISNYLGR